MPSPSAEDSFATEVHDVTAAQIMGLAQARPSARRPSAFLLEPPEERDRVGDVAEVVGRVRTDLRVVDSEHSVVIAGLEMEQRQVPGHVE